MIGQLDQIIKPVEPVSNDPLPVAEYDVIVREIKPWAAQTKKNVKVNLKDEKGFVLKDEKGANQFQLYPELTYYTAEIVFEIVSGEFAGRKIYDKLTTHPNALFITEGFLFAVNQTLSAKDIPAKCVGLPLRLKTKLDTYEKVTTDKVTGFETKETRTNTRVDRYIKPAIVAPQNAEITDLGI